MFPFVSEADQPVTDLADASALSSSKLFIEHSIEARQFFAALPCEYTRFRVIGDKRGKRFVGFVFVVHGELRKKPLCVVPLAGKQQADGVPVIRTWHKQSGLMSAPSLHIVRFSCQGLRTFVFYHGFSQSKKVPWLIVSCSAMTLINVPPLLPGLNVSGL